MNSAPYISVIIPTCFREQMLIDCVASVYHQGYPSFEIIVIDQAPDSELEGKLRKRFAGDNKIQYLHILSAGAARARNAGMASASGTIVAFLDDDAVAAPGWLQAIAEAFSDENHPALMGGRLLPVWTGSRPAWYPRQREFLLGLYDIGDQFRRFPEGDVPIGANMAGLREVILDHGGFDESLGFNYFRDVKKVGKRRRVGGEETILGQRIMRSGHTVVYQPRAVVKHHVSPHKQTRQYFLKRHFWEGVTVIEQMRLLAKTGDSDWPHIRFHLREICMAFARFLLPGQGRFYSDPYPAIRMLSLGRICYSLGVIWGLHTTRGEAPAKNSCASA